MFRNMKIYKLLLSALFTLCFSVGFSQIQCKAQSTESSPLTAMNLATESSLKADVGSSKTIEIITTLPKFVGGGEYTDVNAYIYANLKFPEDARVSGRSGLVKVQFDIEKNGTIGNVDFVESPDSAFNEEVLRLLNKMPNWNPALSGYDPVKTRYQLNINFSLR